MRDAGGRVIFLTGAPLSSSLTWTEKELCAPLQAGFKAKPPVESTAISTEENRAPSWRLLPLEKPHLPTGLTQLSRENLPFEDGDYMNDETSFLSTASLSFRCTNPHECSNERSEGSGTENEQDLFTQYYEHSFALHETIPSSQIIGADSLDDSFATDPSSFPTAHSSSSQSQPHPDPAAQLARSRLTSAPLSDLKDMPNAAHLRSITPQTMTVNLVVGIISISQPRAIRTRKGGRSVELVELLVGDDTKAGFGINIWLPPPPPALQESAHSTLPQHLQNDNLRTQTSHLRPQDIVLAKTVALSSFRGQVYGQSLRRGMTTLDLLYRNVVDGDDARGAYGAAELEQGEFQVGKVREVKEWVMRFVGAARTTGPLLPAGGGVKSRVGGKERRMQVLPDDTPVK